MKLSQKTIQTIDKALILLFFISVPFQRRHIFLSLGLIYQDFTAFSLYFSDLIVLLLIIWQVIKRFGLNVPHEAKYCENWLILGIFLLSGILNSFPPHETFTWYSIVKWLELFAIFYYFTQIGQKWKTILQALAISGLFQSIIGITQFVIQSSIGLRILGENILKSNIAGVAKIETPYEKLIRAYGTFAHPNQLAAFLAIAAAAILILIFLETLNKQKVFYIVVLYLALLIIETGEMVTFSRAGIISLLLVNAMAFGLVFRFNKQKMPNLEKIAIISIICLVFAGSIIVPYGTSRFTTNDQSTTDRIFYDKVGIKLFEDNPLGVGFGKMMPAMASYIDAKEIWQVQPPHNYFIDVACETGTLGLILIIFFLLRLFYKQTSFLAAKSTQQILFNIFCLTVLVSILFLMQFDHYFYTLQQTQLLLWAMLGIIGGNVSISRAYS